MPVRDHPNLFVLEVDATPSSLICKQLVFSVCHDGRVITNVRIGSSNIQEKDWDEG